MKTALAFCVFAVLFLCMFVAAFLLDGWVTQTVWGWFVVPIFGIRQINLAEAVGLGLVTGLFTHQYIPTQRKKEDGSTNWEPIAHLFLRPLLVLFIAWIVTHFLP
jgi:hypothetical protein